jgi:hypothetical protein
MSVDEFASIVAGALETWGFHVERVPEANEEKRPDLRATKANEVYLVEVKQKHDAVGRIPAAEAAYARGEQFIDRHELGPRGTINSIVKDAVQQITAHPDADDSFRVLWYASQGHNARVYLEQIEATLYGSTTIFDIDDPSWQRLCYFFHESGFFRWRASLDAAVLSLGQHGWMCLNPHSPRLTQIRAGHLAQCFNTAVRDPVKLESDGTVVIADCSLGREDTAGVLEYLGNKIGRHVMNIPMRYMSVSFTLPNE